MDHRLNQLLKLQETERPLYRPLLDPEDFARIYELETCLDPELLSLGARIGDRAAWDRVPDAWKEHMLDQARQFLGEADVVITQDVYLRYSTMGDRKVCDDLYHQSDLRIHAFAMAECIENKGEFLPALERGLLMACAMPTWVMTAHDNHNDNFYGRNLTMDLGATTRARELASILWTLGDRLKPDTRALVQEHIMRRVMQPFQQMVAGVKPPMWWFFTTNNWGAVCLGNILCTALCLCEDTLFRALSLTVWEKYMRLFLSGFSTDGYCSEGPSYWAYGFGYYLSALETVRLCTKGKLDFLNDPQVQKIALFPSRIALSPGVYPSVADCRIGYVPEDAPLSYVSARLGLAAPEVKEIPSRLFALQFLWFPAYRSAPVSAPANPDEAPALRSWFPQSGMLVCRPGAAVGSLAASLKGGNNREHHNHNDVGSFVVAARGVQLISDIGHEGYTADTFSDRRYLSNFYNSHGHSVPAPAGLLQKPARDGDTPENRFACETLKVQLTDALDTWRIDLAPVYDDARILRLERSFAYSRGTAVSLSVEDRFAFATPQIYETAVMTYGTCTLLGNRIVISRCGAAVEIAIACDAEVALSCEELPGNILFGDGDPSFIGQVPKRICIRTVQSVGQGAMALTITETAGS